MTAKEAKEWELFNMDEPPFEQVLIDQLALIAQMFAQMFISFFNAFSKSKIQQKWKMDDFKPKYNKYKTKDDLEKEELEKSSSLLDMAWGLVRTHGDKKDKKSKKKLDRRTDSINNKPILGKDGKRYKYYLEQFIKPRTKLPKRLQQLQQMIKKDK